jgi:predicted nuclease of predicted toxin-antitoxin system
VIFKIDENLPVELADDLRRLGHEADSVKGEGMAGAGDKELLGKVKEEGRVLLTMDKGVADVRRYPPKEYGGIVLLRPGLTGRRAVLDFVRQQLSALLQMPLKGRLVVVSRNGIRIR